MRAVEPEDLLQFRTIDDVQLAPDGKLIAFTLTAFDVKGDGYFSNLWMVSTDGGDPFQFTYSNTDSAPRWSPDGRHIAFLSTRHGKPQVYIISTQGGEAHPLTSLPEGAGTSVWSPDSAKILYSARVPKTSPSSKSSVAPRVITRAHYKAEGSGYIRDASSHIFVTSLDGETRQLTFGEGDDVNPTWSPDGQRVAYSRMREGSADFEVSDIWVMRADGSDLHRLREDVARALSPTWSPRGDAIACYTTDGPLETWGDPNARVCIVPLNAGRPYELAETYDRSVFLWATASLTPGPIWSADGTAVTVPVGDEGNVHLVRLGVHDGTVSPIVKGARQILASSINPASGQIAFCATTNEIPCDIYTCDGNGATEKRLTRINDAILKELTLPTIEPRTFKSPHGGLTRGWLLKPPRATLPCPLLLDVHGGPHGFVGNAFSLYYFYRYVFASRGWMVLVLNPSGSGSYGTAFAERIRGHWGEVDMPEQMTAVNELVAEGTVDPKRLAVTGASYGGYITAWLISHTDRFRAAVIGAPVINLESMYGTSDVGLWFQRWQMDGDLTVARERYKRLSPITFVDQITTPTLLLHGELDDRCPIGQSEELFTGLIANGKAHAEFVRYPGSSHRFIVNGRPSHRVDYGRRVWEWITRHME